MMMEFCDIGGELIDSVELPDYVSVVSYTIINNQLLFIEKGQTHLNNSHNWFGSIPLLNNMAVFYSIEVDNQSYYAVTVKFQSINSNDNMTVRFTTSFNEHRAGDLDTLTESLRKLSIRVASREECSDNF